MLVTGLHVSDTVPPSAMNAARSAAAAGGVAGHVSFWFIGHVITGGVLSLIVNVWKHVERFPHASTAL
jgi:hypothetical protein